MSLREILDHRRAIRHYDPEKPLAPERVKECIKMATLAPTSSNMQLWEAYHVTDKAVVANLAHACLDQLTARSAQEMGKRLGITVFQPRLKVCTFARTNYYEYGKQRQVQESP